MRHVIKRTVKKSTLDGPDLIVLDHPNIQRAKRARSLRILQGKAYAFDTASVSDGESPFGPRIDGHNWHLHQTQPPLFRKHEHWRHNLLCVFDQWAGRMYIPGKNSCFLFAVSCLDAMLGTKLYDRHIGQWETIKGFYQHVRVVGSIDFFDVVGLRAPLSEATPGDLVQEEVELNGKLYLHWGIISDKPRTQISFVTVGLCESTTNRAFRQGQTMRIWRLLDPIEGSAV